MARMNIPNALTYLRIALIPLIVVVFYLPWEWSGPASALIFALGGVTDWLDGYLARRLGQESHFGAFLDPVADKLTVAAVLVMVTEHSHAVHGDWSVWLAVAAIIIIGREIAISALREWMAEIGQRARVAVSYIGKVKTTAQMIALTLLLFEHPLWGIPVYEIGLAGLFVAAALTLWSMLSYLRAAIRSFEAQ
ncbi:MAG: CDP-diacylglycerol--glycerol-3-phosphate 3-phosphatidyltransferase [Gammaproteobacteria bacterium]|nr:CDP-diacylglycerol--glycerol-3-phosphate 3-phosphatidyltransferase [Gammaproteobacteria bacterium]MDX5374472.1 CDP-diacylglycerol--glycerol-3-phosphate 3-phosphatidyltransferase [Gammaproteobacteria bacterium]